LERSVDIDACVGVVGLRQCVAILEAIALFERVQAGMDVASRDESQRFVTRYLKTPGEWGSWGSAGMAAAPGTCQGLLDDVLCIVLAAQDSKRLGGAPRADQRPIPVLAIVGHLRFPRGEDR
jgi:hypothetical protein